jgi:hypothetical protein
MPPKDRCAAIAGLPNSMASIALSSGGIPPHAYACPIGGPTTIEGALAKRVGPGTSTSDAQGRIAGLVCGRRHFAGSRTRGACQGRVAIRGRDAAAENRTRVDRRGYAPSHSRRTNARGPGARSAVLLIHEPTAWPGSCGAFRGFKSGARCPLNRLGPRGCWLQPEKTVGKRLLPNLPRATSARGLCHCSALVLSLWTWRNRALQRDTGASNGVSVAG